MNVKKKSAYAMAGVDIDNKMAALEAIKRMVKKTSVKGVLSDIGMFGGLFASPGKNMALVASTDGVGTKLKAAVMARRHDTVGQDIVNHCVNDILVQGATPLFFMDYVGTSKFEPWIFKDLIAGLCKACRENGCALLGGETAEMPGLYPPGEYDLVGTIVGAVDKRKLITGRTIRAGDIIIGLPSTGLHTNGYSLARKAIFEKAGLKVNDRLPGADLTVAEALLAVHRSYLKPVTAVMKAVRIHGMAHITGGGFQDNIPRVLPKNVEVVIDRNSWTVPPLFRFIHRHGRVDRDEMYRVFNMGIGYVLIVRKSDVERTLGILSKARCASTVIGLVRTGHKGVILEG